jgi:hypothetical protein
MTSDVTTTNSPPRDGFSDIDDSGSGSFIRGTKLKFSNAAEWITGTGEVIGPERVLIVVEMKRAVQKWVNELPAETVELGENESWPDIEQWNEDSPPSEWTVKFGKDTGPWQRCWFAYLLCPNSMEGFTWPAGTVGGFKALSELKKATIRARMLRGGNLCPIVTLTDRFMNTQYGGRQAPHFIVKGFQEIGRAEPPALPSSGAPASLASPAAKPAADKNADMGGDKIDY